MLKNIIKKTALEARLRILEFGERESIAPVNVGAGGVAAHRVVPESEHFGVGKHPADPSAGLGRVL